MKKLFKLLVLSTFLTSAINVSAQTVYVNKADSKYHLLSCRFLDPSHDSLDMAIAVKKGFSPCSVCNPSAQGGSSSQAVWVLRVAWAIQTVWVLRKVWKNQG